MCTTSRTSTSGYLPQILPLLAVHFVPRFSRNKYFWTTTEFQALPIQQPSATKDKVLLVLFSGWRRTINKQMFTVPGGGERSRTEAGEGEVPVYTGGLCKAFSEKVALQQSENELRAKLGGLQGRGSCRHRGEQTPRCRTAEQRGNKLL